ncbi:hypothetical protein IFM89_009750 [Coptis chinensis]|uniref:F-box associated beta-propeller type 3 domain-containing protein n=1 Tax=Coptis chinensis TaxID=261450 RepID=A0A835I0F2_9MAGN|nr:hypothetical protein IFM89_009750 [Coptis chinensis]
MYRSRELVNFVGFGFDDTTKKYKVVRFFKFQERDDPCTRGEIITLGEGSWRELELSGRVVSGFNEKPAFSDGAFHWVSEKESQSGCERILALDIYDEKFQTIRIPSSVIQASIRSSETRKDYKFYKSSHSLNFSKAYRNDIFSIKLQDMLIDNKFLFHVRFINLRGREQKKDHLSLYLPEKGEYQVVEVLGAPTFFQPNLFIPSLVSPHDAIGNGVQVN